VHITVPQRHALQLDRLRDVLELHGGDCPVVLHVESASSLDEISLPAQFNVEPGPALERAVDQLVGEGAYRVEIRRLKAPEREQRTGGRARQPV
jgi:hypothetical protein